MKDILTRARVGECLADLDIIDLHGHIGRVNFGLPDISLEKYVAAMDRVGVSKIAVSHMSAWSPDVENGNEQVFKAMRAYPDRIMGYVGIWPTDRKTVGKTVEKWLDKGFTGLKLHNSNGFSYTDDAYEDAFAIADERRLPILFHTWGSTEQDFEPVREIAEKYPNTSLITAHTGAADEEGYMELAKDIPNVYLDLAYSRSPNGLVKRLVDTVGAERVTYGSDAYFFSITHQVGKVLGADISDEDKKKILSTNAKDILDRIQVGRDSNE